MELDSAFRYKTSSALHHLEQMRDGVIDTMVEFTHYQKVDFIDSLFEDKSLLFRILFHHRVDEKNRKFKGVTVSVGRVAKKESRYLDRLDLVFEDMKIDGKFDDEVNQVRLYVNPWELQKSKDFHLLYWDASDRRSLEVFQTGFLDTLLFAEEKRGRISDIFWLERLAFL